ncbi:MAG: sigma 54-interacting transcriptional regulator [Polyangiaceae bacterium]|nr:sigma 54-interacting transcriptional regulator [Polyangiaceae bacterium]
MAPVPTPDRTRTSELGPEPPRLFAFWTSGSVATDLPSDGADLVVGRSPDAGLSIPDASVSRHHAVIRTGTPTTVQDLWSRNGTWVRGRRLGPDEVVPVGLNEVFRVGSVTLVIQGESPALATAHGAPPAALDPPMEELLRLVDTVAKSTLTVLLLGETGVGKEVAAVRIHAHSPRAKAPLIRLNCAALSETLLESELFGHERGAFTGAVTTKMGLFEAADGGTIFLDEIGECTPATQVKLLRVLEQREVQRIGALRPRPIDVRVVAATHRNLQQLVAEGRFREDLYFRMNGITLTIPPLRDRPSEILPLARTFLRDACARSGYPELPITEAAAAALMGHAWPGNVRELKATIERAVVLSGGRAVDETHVALAPPRSQPRHPTTIPSPAANGASLPDAISALERAQIEDALRACDGNQTAAAKVLGISRRTLVYRLSALGITRGRKP